MNIWSDDMTFRRALVVLLAPPQWWSVIWYVRCLELYPKEISRRLIPWIILMVTNVIIPLLLVFSNAPGVHADTFVQSVGVVEALLFLALLFYRLKKLRDSRLKSSS
jgi:hypothetical protein